MAHLRTRSQDVSTGTADVGSTKHLPPCAQCGNGQWNTVTGGDVAGDPYPDS
jgi:hypothetical protein